MIEEQGVITAIQQDPEGRTVIAVKTAIKTTCSSCQAKDNCGTSALATYFAPKPEHLYFVTDQPVQIGQQVSLGIREQHLLTASFLVYIAPLLLFISTILLVQWAFAGSWAAHELVSLVIGILISALAYKRLSRLLQQQYKQYQPELCHILPVQPSGDIAIVNLHSDKPTKN
jgi:sigma-E factor negative regulatory protein RseC